MNALSFKIHTFTYSGATMCYFTANPAAAAIKALIRNILIGPLALILFTDSDIE